jgi:hypothetical protein
MSTADIVDKVVEQLKTLPYELQWRVFEFTRALTAPIRMVFLVNNYSALQAQSPCMTYNICVKLSTRNVNG